MNLLLHIVTPISRETIEVEWVEIQTPVGNRVILPHHAPLIAALSPRSTITFKLADGEVNTRFAHSGVLEVNRTRATLILNDASPA
ncbi:MAG: hypothetical protein M1549_01425 [Candidatus Dependentiae bacterium]|jgi:F0F1-type ATP synthase epsilon subunit|nr:hypothetical protein [Candidatus Dependentiae bacterium]